MRKAIAQQQAQKGHFQLRGENPGRLENFSDAIFALAITFLLISTDPPTHFDQIKRMLVDLIPFLMCMVLFIMVWHEHTVFFLRYGLRNGPIVVLNTAFLFLMLFYVHPLRFLTQLIELPIAMLMGNHALRDEIAQRIHAEDIAELMAMYGFGASAVFFLLAAMYHFALKQKDSLQLSPEEVFDTQSSCTKNLLMGSVPFLSALIALFLLKNMWAGMICGMTYLLYTPLMLIWGKRDERKRLLLFPPHDQ